MSASYVNLSYTLKASSALNVDTNFHNTLKEISMYLSEEMLGCDHNTLRNQCWVVITMYL